MRRGLLTALVLVLVGSAVSAQDFIRYHGPTTTLTAGGSSFFAGGISLGNTSASPYANLYGDAANTLSLRNGTNAQTFYVYYNYESPSKYTRLTIGWNGAQVWTRPEVAGGSAALSQWNFAGFSSFSVPDLNPGSTDAQVLGTASAKWMALRMTQVIEGSKSKSLTDGAAAATFVSVAVPTNAQVAGEMIWTATSSAAAVRFVANGSVRWWGADEGGTPVCGINKIGTDGEGHSSGANTLVCTITNAVSTTNCAIQVTCTNDTAGADPITFNGRLNMPTTAVITFP